MLRLSVKYHAAKPWSVLKAIYKPIRGKKKDITVLTKQEGVLTDETEILHLPATTVCDTTFSGLQALYYVISHSYIVCVCMCSNVQANESH